ncbi:MAG: hypothetical protein H6Q00_3370 [Holophagaceae bacterium]|nr:hypothetical protein [Holophagaceae bacterium]
MTSDPKRTQEQAEAGAEAPAGFETPELPLFQQDTYRKVLFGQAADPLFPPHPEAPEFSDAELQQQALADVPQPEPDADRAGTPMLHWLLLAVIALIALGFLFYCRGR